MIDDIIYGDGSQPKSSKQSTTNNSMAQKLDDYKKERMMRQQKQAELLGSSQKKQDMQFYDDGIEDIPLGGLSVNTKDHENKPVSNISSSDEDIQNIQLEKQEYTISGKEIISPQGKGPETKRKEAAEIQTVQIQTQILPSTIPQVVQKNVNMENPNPPQQEYYQPVEPIKQPIVHPKLVQKSVEMQNKEPQINLEPPKEQTKIVKDENDDEEDKNSENEEAKTVVTVQTSDTKTKLILPQKPLEDISLKVLNQFIEKFTNPLTTFEEKAKMILNPLPKEISVLQMTIKRVKPKYQLMFSVLHSTGKLPIRAVGKEKRVE